MYSEIKAHKFWRSNKFIILIFAIMSLFSGIILLHSGFVNVENDMPFHLNRIYDLRASVANGNLFPSFSLNEFNQSGSAAMSMYPKLNLYPLVFLSFVFKTPALWMYIAFIIRNFISLVIGYFASYYYNENKKVSIIFTVAYTMTTMSLFQGVVSYDLGRSSSMIFLPLILFGALELLDNNKWIELTIGMICLISCHLITPVIVICFLLLLFLVNIKKFKDKNKPCSLGKSIIITILASSFSLVPIISLMIRSNVSTPHTSVIDGVKPINFASPLINHVNYSWTITALIGLILGILCYKNLSRYSKQFIYISILFLFLSSNLFPWKMLNNTFIVNVLQFSWRLFIIPELLLCYIFAILVVDISKKFSKENTILIVVTLLIIIPELMGQVQIIDEKQSVKNDNIYSTSQVKYFIDKQGMGSSDYYPINGLNDFSNIQKHAAVYNSSHYLKTQSLGNGVFSFKSPQNIKELSLPFLYYNCINYQVKLDGKTVKAHPNKHALMTINNVHKGKHRVQIIVHKTKAEIVSYALSIIGLIILLGAIIKDYILKRKNK